MFPSKFQYLLISIFLCFSCIDRKKNHLVAGTEDKAARLLLGSQLQSTLDSAKVKGAIVVYDLQNDSYYSNDFEWAGVQRLPASTFKIPNSIIALELGVVENDSSLFRWDGQERALKIWEQDLIFRDAFHFSCVPCYQDVARRVGPRRMNEYLSRLNYGAMDVDSANIDLFWLEGNSGISQLQQIDFLKRFYESKLPISERTEKVMKELMVMDKNEQYRLSGKTGWAIRSNTNNGWFVGYIEAKTNTYFFATNIEPTVAFDMKKFPSTRKEVTFKALRDMAIIK